MAESCGRGILAGVVGLLGVSGAGAEQVCRPVLAVTEVRFSDPSPPAMGRLWFATIAVDTAHCAENASGDLDLVVTRSKENAPDLEFRARFVWRAPSVKVAVDLGADEAVERSRVEAVTPCPCPG
jgi:hypothetical protein